MAISTPLHADHARGRISSRATRWLVVAAVTAAAVALVLVSRSSLLDARSVRVGGASHLSRAEILAAAEVSRDANVLWLDEGEAERRLESEPWIQDAAVRAELPWTIEITVRERTPVAVASDGIRSILVAGDGTLLGAAERSSGLVQIDLPSTTTGDRADELAAAAGRAVGAMSEAVRGRLSSVEIASDGTLQLRVDGAITVSYGFASRIDRKAESLARILAWSEETGEVLSRVSVVSPELPAVRPAG